MTELCIWGNSSWVQQQEQSALLVSLLIGFVLPVTIVTTFNGLGFFCPHLTSHKESSRVLVASMLTHQFMILNQGSNSDGAAVGILLCALW